MSRLYMMAAITSRSARKKFREFYKTHEQQVFFEILGKGTANSEVLNYFGLEETEKILKEMKKRNSQNINNVKEEVDETKSEVNNMNSENNNQDD